MPFNESEVIIGYGKELAYSDTDGGTYTPIFGTIQVQLPERELGAEEITNDDSPDFTKGYVPGLFEPGTVSFSYRYTRTEFAKVETVYQLATVAGTRANASKYWKCTLPDGSTAKWRGFITAHNLPTEVEGSPEVEGEIQVVGKMTFTAGSGS